MASNCCSVNIAIVNNNIAVWNNIFCLGVADLKVMRGSCWSTEDWREGSRQCQETSKIGYHDECLIYVEVFGRLKEQVFNVALKAG